MEEYSPVFVHYYDGPFQKAYRRITVCLLIDNNTGKVIAKGIAFCAHLDQPNCHIGKEKAKARAERILRYAKSAQKREVTVPEGRGPVNRDEVWDLIRRCGYDTDKRMFSDSVPWLYKEWRAREGLPDSLILTRLTDREQVIVRKFRRRLKAA